MTRSYEHYIFDIAFAVLPDRVHHNGPLFSIGTDNFEYYEWKAKAVKTQFFVVEFIYSAVKTFSFLYSCAVKYRVTRV